MERPTWAPDDVNAQRPSVARVYDYYLGGSHNFAVDREFAEEVMRAAPDARMAAQQNRAFLRRAVRYLCDLGIRQFIDLGSGIPTVGNVHEVAQAVDPTAKVVYVDLDPVAYAHSRAILVRNPHATVVRADLRRPAEVLGDPLLRSHIDFDRPVGLLMVAVLHFVPDEEHPADIVAGYAAALAPGSHVVVSHAATDELDEGKDRALNLYRRSSTSVVLRTAEEVAALFGPLTLVEPGVVSLSRWRPDTSDEAGPAETPGLAAVARRD
ncbi:hypothetical protein HC031_14380 [Planosporangium thailandense]|uniref:S-adenosyl methyltransferase n=1 Tax=Planosporangium thailandense TaxID=765197 RepID=A0ABX0XYM7_9ACTN|nr:hypothetical protein [Planosporangium thailandense]